jgi:hypothetical protein
MTMPDGATVKDPGPGRAGGRGRGSDRGSEPDSESVKGSVNDDHRRPGRAGGPGDGRCIGRLRRFKRLRDWD